MMFKHLTTLLFGSLRRQLIVGMSLVIVAVMSLFIWNMTIRQQDEENLSHAQQVSALAESVATSSAVWGASRDYSGLQEIVTQFARYPDVQYIIMLDLNGQVLAHNDPSKIGLYLTDLPQQQESTSLHRTKNLVDVITPVTFAGKHIGWVRLGMDRSHFNAEIAQTLQDGLMLMLIGIAFSILIAISAGRILTRRLAAIQHVTDKVNAGDPSERVVLAGDDEAARLARQFNSMLDSLAQREAELRFSEQKLLTILDNVDAFIYLKDTDGRYLFANRAVRDLWHAKMQDVVGFGDEKFFDPATAANIRLNDRRVLERGEILKALETNTVSATGQAFIYQSTKLPLRRSDGSIYALCGISVDITERKRAEDELHRYKDHLEEVVAERTADLILARDAADAANRAKSVFLTSMSHELRTPLNAILGFSSLMLRDIGRREAQQNHLEIINRSGEHLLTLINDILEMSKIEAGRTQLNITDFNLEALVRDVTDMMEIRAREKGLRLQIDHSSHFPRHIRGDEARLRQILINLVGNAVKFTEQGAVTIRLGMKVDALQPHMLIEIEDSGPGISPEDQQRLFQPFVQLGKQAGDNKGTGLGLSITRQFVQLMGGTISVDSTVGKGSIFCVDLPVEMVEATDMIKQEVATFPEVLGLLPGQPILRILIVEDQLENQMLLSQLMQRIGFEVKVAEDGKQGVQQFQSWHPHLIWMDRRMPVMDGIEATKAIRALPGGKEVKIVAVTASAFMEQREEMLVAGMDDFVRKPYRFNEIYECLTRQLGVQYTYAETQATKEAPVVALTAEMLAVLPPALREELRGALESLESERIRAAIQKVAQYDASLQKTLVSLADNFDYPAILNALKGIAANLAAEN